VSEGNRARWLLPLGIGVAVIALVVIALVREPVLLDPDSPEGTVQVYLQAISDEDYDKALALLNPDEFENCDISDLARNAPNGPFTATLGVSDEEGRLRRVEEEESPLPTGDLIAVNVTLRFGSGGLFGGTWEQYETFFLTSSDGFWWISDDPWPYFTWDCKRGDF